ncbi:DUF6233 domain-containing protein [Streptomyces mirabilis]|uniref:DUF6233 domain-containing protein n=1 Tax=Streptomyces mirabilis TaxID=68239 RepID=UPI0036857D70
MAAAHRHQDRRPPEAGRRTGTGPEEPATGAGLDRRTRHRQRTPTHRNTRRRCYAAGTRRRPVPRDEARRLLTSGVRACTHCKPDTQLRILD